jgi:ferritin-like metal-binding protein YciE
MAKSTSVKKTSRSASSSKQPAATTASALQEFFIEELKDIYWAEKHLVKSLPKMQKGATTEELQNAIADHLEATQEQVNRLEQVFELLETKATAKKCEAMAGLVEEAQTILEDTQKGTATRDVAIIMAAQKVEHYEIATYGGLVQLAKTLGLDEAADILAQTLQEEKDADELLTSIAENNVNYEASEEGKGEEYDDEEEA